MPLWRYAKKASDPKIFNFLKKKMNGSKHDKMLTNIECIWIEDRWVIFILSPTLLLHIRNSAQKDKRNYIILALEVCQLWTILCMRCCKCQSGVCFFFFNFPKYLTLGLFFQGKSCGMMTIRAHSRSTALLLDGRYHQETLNVIISHNTQMKTQT